MSGHSKWSTIKHQKGVADQARGKLFSKLSKAIIVAAKEGGPDPESNYKLRAAIDEARAANMPKDNIQRAIDKVAGGDTDTIEEVTYEGYGPQGVGLLIMTTTDNRNRTGAEIKNILEKSGGSLGGPGSVSFNFKPLGQIRINATNNADGIMLTLIDLGVEDVNKLGDSEVVAYVEPADLHSMLSRLQGENLDIISSELIQKPITTLEIADTKLQEKIRDLLEQLGDHDDVQKVFCAALIS